MKSSTEPLKLGRCFITPGAIEVLEETSHDPGTYLARHQSGDWGDLDAYDKQANVEALKDGTRIFSCYKLNDQEKIYIITEWDRSSTTILLPREY